MPIVKPPHLGASSFFSIFAFIWSRIGQEISPKTNPHQSHSHSVGFNLINNIFPLSIYPLFLIINHQVIKMILEKTK
jgi:hypothetical protein